MVVSVMCPHCRDIVQYIVTVVVFRLRDINSRSIFMWPRLYSGFETQCRASILTQFFTFMFSFWRSGIFQCLWTNKVTGALDPNSSSAYSYASCKKSVRIPPTYLPSHLQTTGLLFFTFIQFSNDSHSAVSGSTLIFLMEHNICRRLMFSGKWCV
jgi:hypothetical protein